MPASYRYPVTLNLRISDEVKAALEELALEQGLSVAHIVRMILKEHLLKQ